MVEVIMEHLSTLVLIVMFLGPLKASTLGGPDWSGRWAAWGKWRENQKVLSPPFCFLPPMQMWFEGKGGVKKKSLWSYNYPHECGTNLGKLHTHNTHTHIEIVLHRIMLNLHNLFCAFSTFSYFKFIFICFINVIFTVFLELLSDGPIHSSAQFWSGRTSRKW